MSTLRPGARDSTAGRVRGQALAEFAIASGVFMVVIGAIIQFGLILWTMNALTQVARDTARWAVVQSATPCDSGTNRTAVAEQADRFAQQWSLLGHQAGTWTTAGPIASLSGLGVGVDWPIPPSPANLFPTDCPPSDNTVAWFVRVQINHAVPIFFPGLEIVAPSCGSAGFCVSTSTALRMEPKAP